MTRKLRIAGAFLLLLILWHCLATALENEIILPYPIDVVKTMLNQLQNHWFYTALLHTLIRIICGFLLALIIALLTAFLTYLYPWTADLLYPVLLLTRSIPNISYILIVLFWCSPQTSVIVISFLILFPTIYSTLYQGLNECPKAYLDVMKIYPGSKRFDIFHVYLPYLRPYLYTASTFGLSLALKVGIMAEILGQASDGIGRQLNICRSNLDMAGVFAWTVWIITLLFLLDHLLTLIKQFAGKSAA